MWRLVLLVAYAGAAIGCGGSVSKADHLGDEPRAGAATAGAASGAGASDGGSEHGGVGGGTVGGAATGGSAHGGATSEPLGDPRNPNYPPVPGGGGAFFWRWGLGNWFIHTSSGIRTDGMLDEDAGTATWRAEGKALESVDLWAQLKHPSGMAVDLSAYAGVSFDAQLTGAVGALVVVFNANGDYSAADSASDGQRFNVTGDWQTYQLRFEDVGYAANATKSIDFIVRAPNAAFVLKVRNLALLCSGFCP